MKVETLYFEGCPHWRHTHEAVERLVRELGIDAVITAVDIADLDEAIRYRFLGSPTVRVDGHDIEPGADERDDYVFGCRIYRTESGFCGMPDERWIRTALQRGARRGL